MKVLRWKGNLFWVGVGGEGNQPECWRKYLKCLRWPKAVILKGSVWGVRWWGRERVCKWGSMYVKGPWHRTTLQMERWATTLVMPPLAIPFCPNHSQLIHQAETFHISSLRSFWQLTSCSMLFFAMMAWASHSAFSAPLPTAVLPAVQCSKSVPRPKL